MDKYAIKKYAVWARTELITRVSQRAEKYDITAEADVNASSVNGVLLSDAEKKQRKALIEQVKQKGFDQVMEEVAYTWFNRFIALRFMEVNGYLPSHIRVFTDDNNNFKPQILAEAIHLELDGLDMEKVYEMKNNNENDELYKYLIITQCNELSKILPGMFQKISDFTELLFPDNILREGSVIEQMISVLSEDEWKEQVQIVGWLYQYYNSEPKDKVFAALKKNIKITKENIPAATQLFTPDWIVRYMVENSLGRLWTEGHANSDLRNKWEYYLDDAEQDNSTCAQLDEIKKAHSLIKPEEILCIDPSCGSGHILTYMFDMLISIYEDYGISTRDAVKSIVQNNLWGLDIDERAAQLAYFSVMMRAAKYDRRFLNRKDDNGRPDVPQPHIYSIRESNSLDEFAINYFLSGNKNLELQFKKIIEGLKDAKEYGSLITVDKFDYTAFNNRFDEIKNDISIYKDIVLETIYPVVQVAQALSQEYHIVVTNPPYMGQSGMNVKLSNYIKKYYKDTKMDLFSCFMQRGLQMIKEACYMSMITMESWMFLASFENMRKSVIFSNTLVNLVHMPYLGKGGTSLGINFGTSAFVFFKGRIKDYYAKYDYIRYFETDDEGIPFEFPTHNNRECVNKMDNYVQIPGTPFVYSAGEKLMPILQGENRLESVIDITGSQHKTADNEKYLRCAWEPSNSKVGQRWITYSKGGSFRRWWGNIELLVDWSEQAQEFYRSNKTSNMIKEQYRFREGITWTATTNNKFSARILPATGIFDVKGPALFPYQDIEYYLGLLNSSSIYYILKMFKEGADYQNIEIKRLPLVDVDEETKKIIIEDVKENIKLVRDDWNERETSLEFSRHPLVGQYELIEEAYTEWKEICNKRFQKVKENEEEINKIFIDLYGLNDELTPEVNEEEVSIKRTDLKSSIISLISYAVGCMFGRYSLDHNGLVYAGDTFDKSQYISFRADEDGILPICDDEYFSDDITGRFIDFIRTVYGQDTLEENLDYIAKALGGIGTSRNIIRNYFINDFFNDHCAMYSVVNFGKRPIYWLFDSGKKNGFKCLIYMHRYQPDTIARIRTDYVHEQQSRYRTAIEETENRLLSASGSDKIKLNKELKRLREQDAEIHLYEEKIHHFADQMISIDFDAGVKVNYSKFQDVLARIQ